MDTVAIGIVLAIPSFAGLALYLALEPRIRVQARLAEIMEHKISAVQAQRWAKHLRKL